MAQGVDAERRGLRIALFTALPLAYWLANSWAASAGQRIATLVTTPGPPSRRTNGYREVLAQVPPEQDVLITTRMDGALALLASDPPDLLLTFVFPHRIPAALRALPTIGAYNLHPTPLPQYRGPNPQRMLYDGATTVGASFHRLEAGFDTGAILSRRERAIAPMATGEEISQSWVETMAAALTDGMDRAVRGEPGEVQDEAAATYAAPFTEEEYWLDWRWPALMVQRRAIALNIFGAQARAIIDGLPYLVFDALAIPDIAVSAPVGAVLDRTDDRWTIQAGDGAVRARVARVAE